MSQPQPDWMKVRAGAAYAGGVSPRTFRKWLGRGLRHVRLPGGGILVRRLWIDQFLEGFAVEADRVDRVVAAVLEELGNA